MMYLIGGGMPWSKELNAHLSGTLKNKKSILLIPTTIDDVERNNFYLNGYFKYFKLIGLTIENIHCVCKEETVDDIKNYIDKSDIVFLMGGRPKDQIDWCKKINIAEALLDYKGVLMGTSSGALTLSKKAIITKHKGYPNTLVFDGLDITNGISVEVHYDDRNDVQHTELKKLIENGIECIYALPEGCALVIENNNTYFVGNSSMVIYMRKNVYIRNSPTKLDNIKYSLIE